MRFPSRPQNPLGSSTDSGPPGNFPTSSSLPILGSAESGITLRSAITSFLPDLLHALPRYGAAARWAQTFVFRTAAAARPHTRRPLAGEGGAHRSSDGRVRVGRDCRTWKIYSATAAALRDTSLLRSR